MYVTEEDRIARRAEKIEAWFEYTEALYGNLISRPEETASIPGWDDKPKTRPCECRPQWLRGRLCLACDNTGWRPCAIGEEGFDPYSAQVRKRSSFLLVESDATRKAQAQHRMDSVIEVLERNAQVRAGLELTEGTEARTFRLVATKTGTLDRILVCLGQLLALRPEAVKRASRSALAYVLAKVVPGRLDWPPAFA